MSACPGGVFPTCRRACPESCHALHATHCRSPGPPAERHNCEASSPATLLTAAVACACENALQGVSIAAAHAAVRLLQAVTGAAHQAGTTRGTTGWMKTSSRTSSSSRSNNAWKRFSFGERHTGKLLDRRALSGRQEYTSCGAEGMSWCPCGHGLPQWPWWESISGRARWGV